MGWKEHRWKPLWLCNEDKSWLDRGHGGQQDWSSGPGDLVESKISSFISTQYMGEMWDTSARLVFPLGSFEVVTRKKQSRNADMRWTAWVQSLNYRTTVRERRHAGMMCTSVALFWNEFDDTHNASVIWLYGLFQVRRKTKLFAEIRR